MQSMGVLITNGGAHSADDWAVQTAKTIVAGMIIDPNSPNRNRLELMKTMSIVQIADVLVPYYDKVQKTERERIKSGGKLDEDVKHNLDLDDITDRVIQAMKPLLDAAKEKKLISGFLGKEPPSGLGFMQHLRDGIRERIAMDANTVIEIERGWRRDALAKE